MGNVSTGLRSWSVNEPVSCCRTAPNGCAFELVDGTGSDVEWVRTDGGSNRSMARDMSPRCVGVEHALLVKLDSVRIGVGVGDVKASIGVGDARAGIGMGGTFMTGVEVLVLGSLNTHIVAACSCG